MAERRQRKDNLDVQMSLADKMVAYQRRNAQASASRPRATRSPAPERHQPPPAPSSTTPDPEEFSRRLHISNSSRTRELYRPDLDNPISRRQPEPSTHLQPHPQPQRSPHLSHAAPVAQRLFDPSRDDPMRFGQQHKSSSRASQHPDWMSVSGSSVASSNAPSVLSSVLTLTSNTTGSEGSSQHQKTDESSNNSWLTQIKKLYRDLSACEAKLKDVFDPQEENKIVLKSRNQPNQQNAHNERLLRMIAEHKHFTDICHTFLTLTLSPLVPASVHGFPTRCNIPSRLWAAIIRPLETLRAMSTTSPIALEHFSDFIYFAYGFYTCLFEEQLLNSFKSYWLEALGDLARYRMALAAHLAPSSPTAAVSSEPFQTLAALPASEAVPTNENASASPSIGLAAAAAFELEPEPLQWRRIARDWYGDGLKDQPGNGKLHHHIGLLCGDGETLRALYHYAKSMTVLHPFSTARESVQSLFGPALTAKRLQPEAKASELFVVLHGMLFTNIQLDEFETILARFLEKLQLEVLEEREWIMMAITNIAAVLDYGKSTGVLRAVGVFGEKKDTKEVEKPRAGMKRKNESSAPAPEEEDLTRKMDVDEPEETDEPPADTAGTAPRSDDDVPVSFSLALRLMSSMLRYVLRHPKLRRTPVAPSSLNPYIPVLFTFLATMFRHSRAVALMERSLPWEEMTAFLAHTPRSVLNAEIEAGAKLTSGCDPSQEDWCLRGMEWLGRRVYERGFWARTETGGEMDFIQEQKPSPHPTDEGIIEDDSDGANPAKASEKAGWTRRWTRVCRAAGMIGKAVPGFVWERQQRRWVMIAPLVDKVQHWNELEQQHAEDLQRKQAARWTSNDDDDVMDIDGEDDQSESEDDDEDDEQIKALRARRRSLRALLQTAHTQSPLSPRRRRRGDWTNARRRLRIVPGYTVLVVDTNVLLTDLAQFSALVKSGRWTVVVPLAVITELDGLVQNPPPLGQVAKDALRFITDAIRTHGSSLKIQTSKGNYLSNSLVVRSEQVHFSKEEGSWERNMDDLILRSALWQFEHWVDRSSILSGTSDGDAMADDSTSRVVLVTFDRNLRLKAASRQLDAADEKDMSSILPPT
ncbi:hypothetical protein BKA62DRAFT_830869 [Auriculariales sp. MPI-PUGE-AT-0066]|nr:hypothetical protein BKA62DRAFT_830869 [Auriculariales sp. MPI-PUGE-AT-0066]